MLPKVYTGIIQVIRFSRGIFEENTFEECYDVLQQEFPSVPVDTLRSIYAYEYELSMRERHLTCSKLANDLYERYCTIIENGSEDPGRAVLLNISEEVDLAPVLLARIILEYHYEKHPIEGDIPITKEDITDLIKDSSLIKDARLASEVFECVTYDNLYGPQVDVMKHSLGQEYEMYLLRVGASCGLTFCEEDDSRGRGFDKTPDVKLDNPVLVHGSPIFWIESKALFANEELHESYVQEQYSHYCTRFGPGMVIYWLGFVDTILATNQEDIIICEDFPSSAIKLLDKVKAL